MRKEGYYWVKYEGKWVIAEWAKSYIGGNELWWHMPGFSDKDNAFEEIDERPVERNDKDADYLLKEEYFLNFTHVSFNHYKQQRELVNKQILEAEYDKYGMPSLTGMSYNDIVIDGSGTIDDAIEKIKPYYEYRVEGKTIHVGKPIGPAITGADVAEHLKSWQDPFSKPRQK